MHTINFEYGENMLSNNLISQRFMPYNNQIFIFQLAKHYVIPFKSDVKFLYQNITFDRAPRRNNK